MTDARLNRPVGFVDHGGRVYWYNSTNTPPPDETELYLRAAANSSKPAAYAVHEITTDEGTEEWADIHTSPDVAQETADALASTGIGGRFEVVPLFTRAAQSSQAPEPDALRFAWYFGQEDKAKFLSAYLEGMCDRFTVDQWRAAIDAAMAQPAKGGAE